MLYCYYIIDILGCEVCATTALYHLIQTKSLYIDIEYYRGEEILWNCTREIYGFIL